MEIRGSQKPALTNRSLARRVSGRAAICALLLSGATLLLTSCDNATPLAKALDALKSRERKVTAREQAVTERDQQFVDRERQLTVAAASLEQQRAELETLKKKLLDEIDLAKRMQDAALLREKRGPAPAVSAERVIVMDPVTGEILAEKNADRKAPVASTQKLLTALLVIEAGDLDKMVTIEKDDSNCAPVKIYLGEGEQYSRRQLLTALMVKSFNNIARALARDNAGSQEAFAKKMNERARQLGMTNSHFVNPNGLPAEGQYSTARDMAALAKAADALPEMRSIVSTRSYVWRKADGGYENLENTNRVLRTCEFCDGMKTGYTDASGYCLVASGEREGRRRIVVVLSNTSSAVWKDTEALLEWALKG
jgi:D-alanyl-D-alanine carboxypeptidase (penicillin-binding protein 5/6)